MIKVIYIPNQFEPKKDRVIKEHEWKGKKLYEYLPPINGLVVSLNQVQVTNFDIIPHDNSEIIITHKQEASAIGAIAGWIYGLATGGTIVGVGAAGFTAGMALSYVAATAIVIAGSMLLSSVLAPQAPNNQTQNIESSPTYSWNQSTTTVRTGSPIPVLYGKHSLSGNIIQRRIEYVGDDEYLYLQLALCSGEIKDLYDGNIKINDTPITDYSDVEWRFTNGTINQDVMEYFGDIETPNSFNVDLLASSVTRQTVGNANEALRLFIQFPNGIYYQNDSGGLDTRSVEFRVEYRAVGSTTWITHFFPNKRFLRTEYLNEDCPTGTTSWSTTKGDSYCRSGGPENPGLTGTRYTGTSRAIYDENPSTWIFKGAKTSTINREIRIDNLSPDDYEVRVTRLTSVSTDPRLQTTSKWTGMGEIIKDDLYYPTIAILGLRIKATGQLSGDVNISTIVERKQIDVFNELGVSQGLKNLDNPAWCFWDILTNKLYGYGLNYNRIDYDTISDWALWCDEIVNNGISDGGEKRAVFNGVFDFSSNVLESLTKIATVGRGVPIIKGTKYSVIVDKAVDYGEFEYSQLFNMGNIKKGTLSTTYIATEDLATEVEIQFTNEDKDYINDTVTVVVPEWFSTSTQAQKTTIQQMGITKLSQAYRAGRFYLNSNRLIRRVVEFEAHIDSIDSEAGDVIGVSHDVPMWGESGRLVSATTNTITIDKKVQLIDGEEYEITVRLNDNSFEKFDILFSGTQTTSTMTIDGNFTEIPSQYDLYSLIEKNNEVKLFRINSITRKNDFTRKIRAVEYNESLVTDDTTILPTSNPSEFEKYPKALNIQTNEHLEIRNDGTIVSFVDLSWDTELSTISSSKFALYISSDGGSSYYKRNEDIVGRNFTFDVISLQEGKDYLIKIAGKSTFSDYESIESLDAIEFKYLGKIAPPSDVEDFNVSQNGNFVDFTWTHITDVDRQGYEIRKGATWETASKISEVISNNSYSLQAEMNGTYEYLIKAIDTSNIYSLNSTSKNITLMNIDETVNAVISDDEAPSWNGIKTNFYLVNNTLINTSALLDDDIPTENDTTIPITDYDGSRPLYCEYESEAIDTSLVGLTKIRILESVTSTIFNITDLEVSDRLDTDYPLDTDISITAELNKNIMISVSDDDVTYSDYEVYLGIIEKEFRYVKIMIRFDFDIPNTRVVLDSLKYILDVPDSILSISNFSIGASGEDVLFSTYGKQFYVETFISATVLNGGLSLTPDIVGKTLDGFHIDLYNSSDVKTSGVVDLVIRGY